MKVNTATRVTESAGVVESGAFGISQNDTAHIMGILRDQLYSDKILAVLREYSTNAWDAHRDAGKTILPIEVTLPTFTDSTLRIRDFGAGLSKEQVFKVYTQYGASTKRTNNMTVGMLGIGSKSGFAYSDSFTITSFNGGMKRMYVAALDASEKGVINLLHEEPSDETGIQIEIAVQPNDIPEFENKAKELFRYFNPRPEINVIIPELPQTQRDLKNGVIYTGLEDKDWSERSKWVAVMGCIPYRINLQQLKNFEEGISEFLYDLSGALFFDIGEVHISASREELKYTNQTKKALTDKFNSLVEEFVRNTLDKIETGNLSVWEKRVRYQDLVQMKLPIPQAFLALTDTRIELEGKVPACCLILDSKKELMRSFGVHEDAQLVIKDDNRALQGFHLSWSSVVVRKAEKNTPIEDVVAAVQKLIGDLNIEGIPVKKTSELAWVAKQRPTNPGVADINKHRVNTFKLKIDEYERYPRSRCWEIESREPTADDVFVLIDRFKTEPRYGFNIYSLYRHDKELADVFGHQMPPLYGYKVKEKDHRKPEEFVGTYYTTWRTEFFKSFFTDDVKEMLEQWAWAGVMNSGHRFDIQSQTLRRLKEKLGKKHTLVQMFRKHVLGKAAVKKKKDEAKFQSLERLYKRVESHIPKPTAQAQFDAAIKQYPLFNIEDFELSALWGPHAEQWLHYIRLVDESNQWREKAINELTTSVHHDQRQCDSGLEGQELQREEGVTPLREPEESAA